MAKRIIWSKIALENKFQILYYWKNRNKSNVYSRKLNCLFKDTAKLLLEFPALGRETDNPQVKNIIVRDYLMFYKETKDSIIILHIWDGRQNPDKLKYKFK